MTYKTIDTPTLTIGEEIFYTKFYTEKSLESFLERFKDKDIYICKIKEQAARKNNKGGGIREGGIYEEIFIEGERVGVVIRAIVKNKEND